MDSAPYNSLKAGFYELMAPIDIFESFSRGKPASPRSCCRRNVITSCDKISEYEIKLRELFKMSNTFLKPCSDRF